MSIKFTDATNLGGRQQNDWFARIDDIGEKHGFFEQLGAMHAAAFLKAGTKLLVTFENAEYLRNHTKDGEPCGFAFTRNDDWSHLAILSFTQSWFWDPAIYAFFDRLGDEGFFDGFDQVLFYGAHGGGYAAAAYCIAAPGAHVLALRPQATLDPNFDNWDADYQQRQNDDFSLRFNYAPKMTEAADQAYILFDPMEPVDAMHASLFQGNNITHLRAPLSGQTPDDCFARFGIHTDIMHNAMDGTLDAQTFQRLYRARRDDTTYAQRVITRLRNNHHPQLAAQTCRYMLGKSDMAFFRDQLKELTI